MVSEECLATDSWSRETMVGGAHICSDFDFHGVNTPIIADFKFQPEVIEHGFGERCTQLPVEHLGASSSPTLHVQTKYESTGKI